MNIPRVRMVAGPNGSGKTTLLNTLAKHIPSLGRVLNPDEMERDLRESGSLDFASLGIQVRDDEVEQFVRAHPLDKPGTMGGNIGALRIENGALLRNEATGAGYFAAILADFVRRKWAEAGKSFTFETVMSSGDKVEFIRSLQVHGYRRYLYFICTDAPRINQERVVARVFDGGHSVATEKIVQRYYRSLSLLVDAIRACNRAYLFDNSGAAHRLIAEFEEGRMMKAAANVPNWFLDHVISKMPGGA